MNKEKIARSFLRGQKTYDSQAKIQRKVSERLIGMLRQYQEVRYDRVLEMGCCTGILTEMLVNSSTIGKLYLNDLVAGFYDTVLQRLVNRQPLIIEPVFGDIETLELPQSLDLVISSSTFQWLTDLAALFEKVATSLKDNGYFVFSLFGPGTLAEFKEITGVGLNYSASGSIMDLLEVLFHVEEERTSSDKLYFSSARDVLRHVQATGVGGVQEHRWTSRGIRDFERRYTENFGTAEGIPVSYVSTYVVATKKE